MRAGPGKTCRDDSTTPTQYEHRRILFVNTEGRIAGAENSLLLLLKYLSKIYELVVACPSSSDLSREVERMGIPCYGLVPFPNGATPLLGKAAWWCRNCYLVAKIAVASKARIIHANNWHAVLVSAIAARITGRHLIWHARDMTIQPWVVRLISALCAQVIAVSRTIRRTLIRQEVKRHKITVIYNGVETDDSRVSVRDTDDWNGEVSASKPIVYVNVGQFVPWKRQLDFIAVASLCRSALPEARFLIVGDDVFGRESKYRKRLLSAVECFAWDPPIVVEGWQTDMSAVWRKAGCLVHTARSEPFGRVITEAMWNRIPVIAVASGGPKEIIRHGESGLLVPPGDIGRLVEAMITLGRDRKLAKQLGLAGHECVKARFTARRTAAEVARLFEKYLVA